MSGPGPAGDLRVTFIGPVPPLRSGIAQHGGHLTAALAETADVTVLSWQHQYPKRLFGRAQVDPDATPHSTARFMLRWWDPLSWWRAGRIAGRSDLVVFPWTTPFHAVPYRLVIALARRVPTVAVVHNAIPHETLPLHRPLSRWVLSRCTGIVVHAASVADEVADLVGPVPTVVTPHPPNIAVEPRPLPGGDEVRLLFFGFVRHYKGVDVAVDALAALAARGVRCRLTIAGELWEPVDTWDRMIADRGLTGQVELRSRYVPDAQVSDLFAEHHAVVLPYRSASQSGIAPVALAAGRPVIATRVGGLHEVVTDGVNGTLADPGDPASLADAIERCVRDLPSLAAHARDDAPTWSDLAAAVRKAAGLA
ncbi:MAG TPA: glycosyltransferase [Acidimicrobiales bacterium]